MTPARRIPLTFTTEPTPWQRLLRFLAPYDLRIYLSDRSFVDVGAGSLGAYECLRYVDEAPSGLIGAIGRWCEVNPNVQIMGNGEHDHNQPVNVGLGMLQEIAPAPGLGLKPPRPFHIGSGVVLSANAVILAGAKIGDGAVIGAGAIVRGEIAPYAIAVGAPAREVRRRTPATPWWDFATEYLLEHMSDIQSVASRLDGHVWRPERPRFVLRVGAGRADVVGFTNDAAVVPLHEAPSQVRDYLAQALSPGDSYWMADCWAEQED